MVDDERVINYRLSRGRRVVENCFGILANKFRCLLTTMPEHPKTVEMIVSAAMCLHNVMRDRYPALKNQDLDQNAAHGQIVPGAWRQNRVMDDMHNLGWGNVENREGKHAQRVSERLLQ